MTKTTGILIGDLIRNRVILGYFILMAALGWGVFYLESQPQKAILLLLQITLLVLPLITIVFSVIYYYNSREFITMLLAQPLRRSSLFTSIYTGLSGSFSLAFLIGLGLPLLIFYPSLETLFLLISGLALSWIFSGLALVVATGINDKARGMGVALILWAFFAFIYDGILLIFMYQMAEYPIESTVLALSFLNPVDIARILVITQTEASALLGISGAVFRDFFGATQGIFISFGSLILWMVLPYALARRNFLRKDM